VPTQRVDLYVMISVVLRNDDTGGEAILIIHDNQEVQASALIDDFNTGKKDLPKILSDLDYYATVTVVGEDGQRQETYGLDFDYEALLASYPHLVQLDFDDRYQPTYVEV
jgi:hypothetical protein